MCNLSWTPRSNLEKDNSLNHSCVSPTTVQMSRIGNVNAHTNLRDDCCRIGSARLEIG